MYHPYVFIPPKESLFPPLRIRRILTGFAFGAFATVFVTDMVQPLWAIHRDAALFSGLVAAFYAAFGPKEIHLI